MNVLQQIEEDFKNAMRNKEADRLSTLRLIKSALQYKKTESGKDLTEDDIISVIQSMVKKQKDAFDQFTQAGRKDLAEKEAKELVILQEYLPEQLSPEELEKIVETCITENNASSMKDMGNVMKAVMAQSSGRADGKLVSELVKRKLSS